MIYKIEEKEYLSSNKKDTIHAKVYIPNNLDKVKGIIQISHGMCEYIDKYKDYMEFMVKKGYIICGNDHLGHGVYVAKDERGFFADENGFKYLVEDVYNLTKIMQKEFKNIPYFLLGHSMGSFIARCYMYKYKDKINGYIIMGTSGPNKLVDTGIKLADIIINKKGKMYRSKFLTNAVIGKFNESFRPNVSKYDWLSSDETMLPKYIKDKTGDFVFTASGYKDLFYLQKNCNLIKNIEKVPINLPVIFLSGSMDPVGDLGKGVLEVYYNFIKTGHTNTSVKLYPNLRHELLNEVGKEKIYQDIINWIEYVKIYYIK